MLEYDEIAAIETAGAIAVMDVFAVVIMHQCPGERCIVHIFLPPSRKSAVGNAVSFGQITQSGSRSAAARERFRDHYSFTNHPHFPE